MDTGSSAISSFGRKQQRAGDHETLSLSTRQLMRETPERVFRMEPDAFAGGLHHLPRLLPRWREAQEKQRFHQCVVHAIERIVNGERVLKDGLHLASERQPLPAAERSDVCTPKSDLSHAGGQEAEKQGGEGRLAAAAFAGDGDDGGAVLIDAQCNRLQRSDVTEPLADTVELNQGCGHAASRKWQAA